MLRNIQGFKLPQTVTAILAILALASGTARAGDGGGVISLDDDTIPSDELGPPPMKYIDSSGSSSGRQVVFLNFSGAKLTSPGNDAVNNQTSLITVSSHDYPALNWSKLGGEATGKAELVKQLKIIYYKYGIEFVTERPTSGEYTMAMIGGDGTNCKKGGAGTVGIAPLDCKNSRKNEVVLIFGALLGSAKQIALVTAHELGHSFGLEHVDSTKSIMYPSLQADPTWASGNVSGGSTCGRTTQDDDAVLTTNLGVGDPDQVAPLIWIMQPGDRAVLPSRFTLKVGAADNFSLASVTIFVDGVQKAQLSQAPYLTLVTGLSDGEHSIKAEARDLKPNVASAEIKVTVDSRCAQAGDCWTGKGGVGMPCDVGSDCMTGACALKDGVGICSASCESATKLCPDDFTCESAGGSYACVKGTGFSLNTDKAGGCSVSGRRGPAGSALLLLAALALLALVARRRPG